MIFSGRACVQISFPSVRLFTPVFVFANACDAAPSSAPVLLSVLLLPGDQNPPNWHKSHRLEEKCFYCYQCLFNCVLFLFSEIHVFSYLF